MPRFFLLLHFSDQTMQLANKLHTSTLELRIPKMLCSKYGGIIVITQSRRGNVMITFNSKQLAALFIMAITFKALPIIESLKQPTKPVASKGNVIDVPDVMNSRQSYQQLLQSHQPAAKKSIFSISSIHDKNNNGFKPLQDSTLSNSTENIDLTTSTTTNKSTTVTPSAFLTSVLQASTSYGDAYEKLNEVITSSERTPAQKKLAQQAQTLLTRTQPDVIFSKRSDNTTKTNLPPIFTTLVRNTISYVQQQLPRLTTYESQLRFTQSVMIEALKTMKEDEAFKDNGQPSPFTANLNKQLNAISIKYANSLGVNNNPSRAFIAQWSRNLVTELVLLTPRAIGAAVGAGAGVAVGVPMGALVGTIEGAGYGGQAGWQAGKDPLSTIGTTVTGAAVGAGIGATARGIQVGTAGAVVGGSLGAQGGEYLARSAATTAGTKINNAAQAVNQSAQRTYSQIKNSLPQWTSKANQPKQTRLFSDHLSREDMGSPMRFDDILPREDIASLEASTQTGAVQSSSLQELQQFKTYIPDSDSDAVSTSSDGFYDTRES